MNRISLPNQDCDSLLIDCLLRPATCALVQFSEP